MLFHALAAYTIFVAGHPALATLAIVPALMMADAPFSVLRVLRRLFVTRRAMREWASCQRSCCRATLTTFPALAAYRELARTGDVGAFAAKDLTPIVQWVHVHPTDAAVGPNGKDGSR